MSPEMLEAAHKLWAAAKEYKRVFDAANVAEPCIFLTEKETGESIFIADSYNAALVKATLSLSDPQPISAEVSEVPQTKFRGYRLEFIDKHGINCITYFQAESRDDAIRIAKAEYEAVKILECYHSDK